MNRIFLFLLFFISSAHSHSGNVTIHLNEVPLVDFVKLVYGEIAGKPFFMSSSVLEARQPVTLLMRDVSRSGLINHVTSVLQSAGFSVENRSGVVFIDKALPPSDEIVVYRPRYRSARYLADIVQPLTGARSLLSRVLPQITSTSVHSQVPNHLSKASQQDQSLTSVAGMTDRGEVDQIAFSISSNDAGKLRKLLSDLDTPVGEVLLKAAVYEVATTRQDGNALKLAMSVAGIEASAGISNLISDFSVKFKLGGIEGILQAFDRDSRFKSLSRPQLRVRNGARARFSVGQDVPILSAQQLDRNGNLVQSIEYKPSGIIMTVLPEIREDVIELDLSQELSNFIVTNTGVNSSPTLIKRVFDTRLGLRSGEIVILAGLQDDRHNGQTARLPFLDWLVGDQHRNEQIEILVVIEAVKVDSI